MPNYKEFFNYYKRIIDNIDDSILIVNHEGYLVCANTCFLRESGFNIKDISVRNISLVLDEEVKNYKRIQWHGEISLKHKTKGSFTSIARVSRWKGSFYLVKLINVP